MMKKPLLIFILRSFILIALLITLDQIAGRTLEYYFVRHNPPEFQRITYALDQTPASVLIFGSSRAVHHYVPSVLSPGGNAYNAGKDGHYISYANGVRAGILKRITPKIIILDINPSEFEKDAGEDVTPLLPYLNAHPELYPVIVKSSWSMSCKINSLLYRMNSLVIPIIAANTSHQKLMDTLNGYIPLQSKWNLSIEDARSTAVASIDSAAVESFRSFIKASRNTDTRLLVFVSPHFRHYKSKSPSLALAKEICARENIPFFDFSDDPKFLSHPEIFADPDHLNDVGAGEYSRMVRRLMD